MRSFIILFLGFLMLACSGVAPAAEVQLQWQNPATYTDGTPLKTTDIDASIITIKQRNKADIVKTIAGDLHTITVAVNGSACVSYLVQTKTKNQLSDAVILTPRRLVKSKLVECKT